MGGTKSSNSRSFKEFFVDITRTPPQVPHALVLTRGCGHIPHSLASAHENRIGFARKIVDLHLPGALVRPPTGKSRMKYLPKRALGSLEPRCAASPRWRRMRRTKTSTTSRIAAYPGLRTEPATSSCACGAGMESTGRVSFVALLSRERQYSKIRPST